MTSTSQLPLWCFSFVDPDRPEGDRWIGGCYLRASSLEEALTLSHVLGCNPGGEVQIIEVPAEVVPEPFPADKLGVLLDREGIEL